MNKENCALKLVDEIILAQINCSHQQQSTCSLVKTWCEQSISSFYSIQTHIICSIHIFITYYPLHVSVFNYTFFRECIALFTLELYASCNVVTQVVVQNVKYTLLCKIYSAFYSVYSKMYFVLLYLKNLKCQLKSLLQHNYICWFLLFTGVPISPQPDLHPDVFCLMVRIFLLMLVLLYT